MFIVATWLAAGTILAAPSPKFSTVVYDPQSDPAVFKFLPTPATCQLHVVSSNCLVWAKYESQQHGRSEAFDTSIYIQRRIAETPTRIVRFGGREMLTVVGVSTLGSLLFRGGEEFIVAGDAFARSSSDASVFFMRDIRDSCPFEVDWVTSPSIFARRLSEDKNPSFTLPVFRKGDRKTIREVQVKAVPNDHDPIWKQVKSGVLPSVDWLLHLWPIVDWDDTGFTMWNGTVWTQFKWNANNPAQATGKPAPGR